jgi:PAS domain-containing protein
VDYVGDGEYPAVVSHWADTHAEKAARVRICRARRLLRADSERRRMLPMRRSTSAMVSSAIALRHAQLTEELRAVIDSAMEGIVVLDDDRTFVSANEPARRLLGDELVGLKVADVIVSSSGEVTLERVLPKGALRAWSASSW